MSYCGDRVVYDADGHIMETPDWLTRHVESKYRDALPPLGLSIIGFLGEGIKRLEAGGAHDAATAEALAANVMEAKGYDALGASNAAERGRALDLIGVRAQLLFSSLAVTQFLFNKDRDVVYAGASAHNRAMAEFCEVDERLFGVALVPLADPQRAVAEATAAIELGLKAIWVRHRPDGDRSPGHPELDEFWGTLADAGVPFVIHIGSSNTQIKPAYMNNGRPAPTDFHGGGEGLRAKDFMVTHHDVESFLSCLVLDGVLERFPLLRGAAVELGASWVPGWLRRLEYVVTAWGKSESHLREFVRPPRQQVEEQMTFTPFAFEDVGALVRDSSVDLYMFGTDYPHIEGTRDPMGRMLSTMGGLDDDQLDAYFRRNFLRTMGIDSGVRTGAMA